MALEGSFKAAGGSEAAEAQSSAAAVSGADPACRKGSRAAKALLLLRGISGPLHRLHMSPESSLAWHDLARSGGASTGDACGEPR